MDLGQGSGRRQLFAGERTKRGAYLDIDFARMEWVTRGDVWYIEASVASLRSSLLRRDSHTVAWWVPFLYVGIRCLQFKNREYPYFWERGWIIATLSMDSYKAPEQTLVKAHGVGCSRLCSKGSLEVGR